MRYGQQLSIWAIVGLFATLIVTIYLMIPIVGMIVDIFQNGDVGDTFSLLQSSLVGIILLATILGGFIIWFVQQSVGYRTTDSSHQLLKFSGKLFLYSALLIAIFLLLSPLIPDVVDTSEAFAVSVKYVLAITFIGGTAAFIFACIQGLIYMWKL